MSIGIQKTFNLDMVPGGAPPIIHVSAGDVGRPFRAVLLYNGETYDLDAVTSVVVRGTKPDKTVFEYDLTFDDEDSHVDFVIEEQMAIVAGQVLCEIRLFSGEDTIGSANFIMDVETAVYDPEAASESYIPSVEAAIEEAVEAVNEAADRAESAADSMTAYSTDRTPYKLRPSGGGVEIGDREYDKIVGGSIAWNQFMDSMSARTEFEGITTTYSSTTKKIKIENVSRTTNYTAGSSRHAITHVDIPANHVVLLTGVSDKNITGVGVYPYVDGSSVTTYIPLNSIARTTDGTTYTLRITKDYDFVNVHPVGDVTELYVNVFDLTQMFGSTIADYLYTLEQTTAGAGVAWFRQFFPEDYYAYNAGELLSVRELDYHIMRDADNNVIGNYPLDEFVELRGLPKLDGGKLYYDGDTYESDGTVTRKYGKVTLSGDTGNWTKSTTYPGGYYIGDWANANSLKNSANHVQNAMETVTTLANYSAKTNVVYFDNSLNVKVDNALYPTVDDFKTYLNANPIVMVYELKTPTTETADLFTNPQVVDPDGTEEYVSGNIVPVGHETRYRVNLVNKVNQILQAPTADGTYTLKCTVSNGEATYFWQ